MTHETEALRLALLANGYVPLPNVDKRCMLKGWPTVVVDADEIRRWQRRIRSFSATGLRIEDYLATIDIDVNAGDQVAGEIVAAIERIKPGLSTTALVRFGKESKEAWFVRTSELFSRIHSRRWLAPGAREDEGTHSVECFGGASPRQFGCFGAHTLATDGSVEIEYEWDGPSPADTPKSQLPLVTKAEFFAIVDAVEAVLERAGFTPILRSQKGESDAHRVYDLTDDMHFDLSDGRRVPLPELRNIAVESEGLRCSASWLEGPSATRTDRCIVGTTRQGQLTVWESASGTTHLEASLKPVDRGPEIDRIGEKLRELQDREAFKLKPRDSAMEAATKLLDAYAFCPVLRAGVVPVWARGLDEGMQLSSFRTMLLPWADETVGPRGGRVVINPVDIWAGDMRRHTVAGLRMRPDMVRPVYEEHGERWVNVYCPPDLPSSGGSAAMAFEFLEGLAPYAMERDYFIKWLAYKVRYPWVPGPAIVMVARQFGTGRGTLGHLMGRVLGQRYVKTIPFQIFAGKSYQSQYTDWGASSLLVMVNESSDTEGSKYTSKRNTYEHIKELIDPRPVVRHYVVKSERAFDAPGATSYIIATNHADALPIPANDRRFFVMSNGEPREKEFWERFNAWMEDDANIGAFVRALGAVDLGDYSPFEAPAMTEAKADMADAAASDLDRGYAVVMANLPGSIFTASQVVNLLSAAEAVYGYDYPEHWKPIAKRMVTSSAHRVGIRDAQNWHPMFDGKRYAIYARSRIDAQQWTQASSDGLREELAKNGALSTDVASKLAVGLFRSAATRK